MQLNINLEVALYMYKKKTLFFNLFISVASFPLLQKIWNHIYVLRNISSKDSTCEKYFF